MSRPVKWRTVGKIPGVRSFAPVREIQGDLPHVTLLLEEVEALRLKDMRGLEQTAAAKKMEVSRSTFQRILSSARFKLADALINGKAIQISGGNYRCRDCGYVNRAQGPRPGRGRAGYGRRVPGRGAGVGYGRGRGRMDRQGEDAANKEAQDFCREHDFDLN